MSRVRTLFISYSSTYPGVANVSVTGQLDYLPERWYFGVDKLKITLREVGLPPVIAPHTVQVLYFGTAF
jgi:hypothetical protein